MHFGITRLDRSRSFIVDTTIRKKATLLPRKRIVLAVFDFCLDRALKRAENRSVARARTAPPARARRIRLIFHTRFYTRGNYNNNRPPRLVPRARDRCPLTLGHRSFREIDLTYSLAYANR